VVLLHNIVTLALGSIRSSTGQTRRAPSWPPAVAHALALRMLSTRVLSTTRRIWARPYRDPVDEHAALGDQGVREPDRRVTGARADTHELEDRVP
jgi:hypothetical protein